MRMAVVALSIFMVGSAVAMPFRGGKAVPGSGYSGTLTITAQPTSNSVAQRDTRTGGVLGKGAGAVAIGLDPSAPLTLLEYRLRDFNSSSTTLVDWTNSGLGSLSSGAQTITLNLDADNHQFILDLRANSDNASIVSTTDAFSVGEIICMAGQSQALQEIGRAGYNAYLMDTTDGSHTVAAGTNRNISIGVGTWLGYAEYRPLGSGSTPEISGWLQPRDAPTTPLWASMVAARLGALFVANEGVSFALCGASTGNTSSAYWASGEGNTDLKGSINSIGGKFGAFFYYQGTADVGSGGAATWQTNVISLIDDLKSSYPGATFKELVSNIPSVTSGTSEFQQQMKAAGQNVADHYNGIASNSAAYIAAFDLDMPNGDVHPTTWGDDIHAMHIYRAWQKLWGENSYGDDGPVITAASRGAGSNVVALTVSQVAPGAALVGSSNSAAPGGATTPSDATLANQFKVYVSPTTYDGSGNVTSTAVTVSAATLVSATEIDLTLGSTPADNVALDVWYRLPPDASTTVVDTGIYDDNTAGAVANLPNGRQLRFSSAAITAAAPVP